MYSCALLLLCGLIQHYAFADLVLSGTLRSPIPGNIYSVHIQPNGDQLAATCQASILIYNTTSYKLEGIIQAVSSNSSFVARAVAYDPSGTFAATGGDDSVVRIWSAARMPWRLVRELPLEVLSKPRSLAWHPSGAYLGAAGQQGYIIWNVADWTIHSREKLRGSIHHMSFSPDGLRYMVDRTVFSIASTKTVAQVTSCPFCTLPKWSPDGTFIITAYASTMFISNGTIDSGNKAWPTTIPQLQTLNRLPTVHSYLFLSALQWSPDGRYIAAGGAGDSNSFVYDSTSEQWELHTIVSGHASGVYSLAWSTHTFPSSTASATSSIPGTIPSTISAAEQSCLRLAIGKGSVVELYEIVDETVAEDVTLNSTMTPTNFIQESPERTTTSPEFESDVSSFMMGICALVVLLSIAFVSVIFTIRIRKVRRSSQRLKCAAAVCKSHSSAKRKFPPDYLEIRMTSHQLKQPTQEEKSENTEHIAEYMSDGPSLELLRII